MVTHDSLQRAVLLIHVTSLSVLFCSASSFATEQDGKVHPAEREAVNNLRHWKAQLTFNDERRVTAVDFSSDGIPSFPDTAMVNLKAFPALRQLDLTFTQVTDRGLIQLKDLIQLRSLTLPGGNEVTDSGLVHITALTHLEELDLSSAWITDDGLRHLTVLKQLRKVGLHYTKVSEGLKYLKRLPNLREIIAPKRVTDNALMQLANIKQLTALSLRGCNLVTDKGLKAIAGLTALEKLELYQTRVSDDGLLHLQKLKKLRELALPHGITDRGLAHLTGLTELETIDHVGEGITDVGAASLSQLKSLREIWLQRDYGNGRGPVITDDGLAHLSKLKNLEVLWIDNASITDDGLKHLAGLMRLRLLALEGAPITGAGLAQLKTLGALRFLRLNGTNINDTGLRHLNGMARLKHLSLRGTKVTEHGKAELRRVLPNCTIE
ncbi:MAG: hypothetical protein IH991_02835 [Planctomycetes bacterium]|nr:hypothetical protein [Planctomycetota bacterium]